MADYHISSSTRSLSAPLNAKTFAELSFVAPFHPWDNVNAEGAAALIQTAWRGQRQRLRLCKICYSNCLPKDTVAMGSKAIPRQDLETKRSLKIHGFCGHHFCKDCATQYLTHAIRDGKSYGSLKCPEDGCGCIVSPVIVDKLCENDVVQLYNKVGFGKMLVSRSPFGRYCPHCNEFIERNNNSSRKVECNHCNKSFCARCSKPYHALTPCKNTASFKVWSTFKNVKRCPRCDFFIEKNGGCQHMQCGQCNHRFCWTCMRSQEECNNVFCKGNIMNHSLFGTSKPVQFVTRGVAGAVALPVVVAAGTIAGTAFVTYKGGELAHKSYKSRKRRRKYKKAQRAREKANRLSMKGSADPDRRRQGSLSHISERHTPPPSHTPVARLTISVVVETEISLVVLKRQLQELESQVKNQLPATENDLSSVGTKWIFVKDTFKKNLEKFRQLYDAIISKGICNGKWCRELTAQKRAAIKLLMDDAFVIIGSLMLCLRNAIVSLATVKDDEALNPKTTYRYDRKTETYNRIVTTDASSLLSDIEELLPKFLGKAPQFGRNTEVGRNTATPDRVKLMRHLLVESGPNPPVYIQQLILSFYKNNPQGMEKDVLFWFRAIRHNIEGNHIEWLTTTSWLYKMAVDTWEVFPGPFPEQIVSLTPSLKLLPEVSRNNARFCLGSICFHHDDLVAQYQHKFEDVKIDLFDVNDLTAERLLLPTASVFQDTFKRPFALGCILQYVTSRHQSKFSFRSERKFREKSYERKYAKCSSFTGDNVLRTLYCALSIIYDSSLHPYLRSMCFYYIGFVIRLLDFTREVFPPRNLSLAFPTGKRHSAPQLTNSDEAFNLQQIKINITKFEEANMKEFNGCLSWKLLLPQLTKACLAVMLHQSSSTMKRREKDEAWLLPCACSCFLSIFENARALTWHLARPDSETAKANAVGESGFSVNGSSWESSTMRQKAEREARHSILDIIGGLVAEKQMRVLNRELKRLSSTRPSFLTGDELWVIGRASDWIPKMYLSQEWLTVERNGATYYVSLNGEVRATLPDNYLVAWKFTGGVQWFENNEWIKKTFPALYLTYYARASLLLQQERLLNGTGRPELQNNRGEHPQELHFIHHK